MTPAIKLLDRKKINYMLRQYEVGDDQDGYGISAANALGQDTNQVFKTLLTIADGNERKPMVAVVSVADLLDLKKMAALVGARKASMAESKLAEKATGYVVGGISPLAQRKHYRTIIDTKALHFQSVYVSGGKRGLQIEIDPNDLRSLTSAIVGDIARA